MRVGAIGTTVYQPYVYNTNAVSRASLGKISPIGDDLLSSKTDFEKAPAVNENPLKMGETKDYAGMLDMQMQTARMNAARFMQPSDLFI